MSDRKYESAGQKQAREQAADAAAVEAAAALAEIKAQLAKQEAENARAARDSKFREWLTIAIAAATLIVAILSVRQ